VQQRARPGKGITVPQAGLPDTGRLGGAVGSRSKTEGIRERKRKREGNHAEEKGMDNVAEGAAFF
jgi:hypothetical protein